MKIENYLCRHNPIDKTRIENIITGNSKTPISNDLIETFNSPYVQILKDGLSDSETFGDYFLKVAFITYKKVEIVSVDFEFRNKKLCIIIKLNEENIDKNETSFTQIIINSKEIGDFEKLINTLTIDYVVEIATVNKDNIIQESNPTGGTTDPIDTFPPKKIEMLA